MEKNNEREKSSIIKLVHTGLMIALIYVATSVLSVPIKFSPLAVNNLIHAGDSMVLIAAVFLGKKRGVFAAAIGMTLFDLLSGYLVWAPFTFVIKGLVALVAASIVEVGKKGNKYSEITMFRFLIAFIIAEIVMLVGYLFAGIAIDLMVMPNVGIKYILGIEIANMGGNLIQATTGVLLALPIVKLLKKNKIM